MDITLDSWTMQHEEVMPEWAYTAAAVVLLTIGIFGFCLNLFVIILMCKDFQIWTPMNIILFNLLCSDFSVSILGNPFTLMASLSHGWIFGDTMCEIYGFFMSLLGITSIATLTVLSFERYCLVCIPFSSCHLSKTGAKVAVLLIWIYSLVLTAPPLFGWGKYVSEAANISCSVNWESRTFNATSYIIFLFVFGLIVPVNVIVFSYIKILMTMRESSMRSGRVNKLENRVTGMILSMIIAFLVAWTPYSIFALSEQFGDPELITPALAVLPALIAKSSICYNPLIYVGMNTQFRAALQRVLKTNTVAMKNIECVTHHNSEVSSKTYIECSFSISEKKKKYKKYESCHKAILNDKSMDTTAKLSMKNQQMKQKHTESSGNNCIKIDDEKIELQTFSSEEKNHTKTGILGSQTC